MQSYKILMAFNLLMVVGVLCRPVNAEVFRWGSNGDFFRPGIGTPEPFSGNVAFESTLLDINGGGTFGEATLENGALLSFTFPFDNIVFDASDQVEAAELNIDIVTPLPLSDPGDQFSYPPTPLRGIFAHFDILDSKTGIRFVIGRQISPNFGYRFNVRTPPENGSASLASGQGRFVAIPEPSSIALVGFSAFLLCSNRRCKRYPSKARRIVDGE